MVMMFFVIPLYIFGLSMAGPVALYIGVLPFITTFIVAIIINVLQKKIPQHLPDILKNWSFLPEWMRSLDPIDRYRFCFSSRKNNLNGRYYFQENSDFFPY
jgi:sodium-dependent phosphate cotransporter